MLDINIFCSTFVQWDSALNKHRKIRFTAQKFFPNNLHGQQNFKLTVEYMRLLKKIAVSSKDLFLCNSFEYF